MELFVQSSGLKDLSKRLEGKLMTSELVSLTDWALQLSEGTDERKKI